MRNLIEAKRIARTMARSPELAVPICRHIEVVDVVLVLTAALDIGLVVLPAARQEADRLRGGYRIFKDGERWCAVGADFVDLQKSPAGFGDTPDVALAALAAVHRPAHRPRSP